MKNPPHLGELVRDEIVGAYGLSVTEAAKILGVSRPNLSLLLNEKISLSPEMALRLEKAFGVNMDLLMRMQTAYDITKTREREAEVKVARWKPDRPPQTLPG